MRQLTAEFTDEETSVRVARMGETLIDHPVEYVNRSQSWIKHGGNGKTQHYGRTGMGIISCLKQGCFRVATGCGRCDQPCYAEQGNKMSGCYANLTIYAMLRWQDGFDVVHNGLRPGTEDFFRVMLPKNEDYSLERYDTKIWRVDSETSTSCMSLALGLTQRWARANPDRYFTGISSDYFHVPDDRVREAVECGNIVIGHTVSPWFAIDDLENRFHQAKRWEALGLPTVLWVASNPEWEDEHPEGSAFVEHAVAQFDSEQIIEVPYHDRNGYQCHSYDVNPFGGCCEVGVDESGNYCRMNESDGKWKGTCRACKVSCGVTWLRRSAA